MAIKTPGNDGQNESAQQAEDPILVEGKVQKGSESSPLEDDRAPLKAGRTLKRAGETVRRKIVLQQIFIEVITPHVKKALENYEPQVIAQQHCRDTEAAALAIINHEVIPNAPQMVSDLGDLTQEELKRVLEMELPPLDEKDVNDYASNLATAMISYWLRMLVDYLKTNTLVELNDELFPKISEVGGRESDKNNEWELLWKEVNEENPAIEGMTSNMWNDFKRKLFSESDVVDLPLNIKLEKREGSNNIVATRIAA